MAIVATVFKGGCATTVALVAVIAGVLKGPQNRVSLELVDLVDRFLDEKQGGLAYNTDDSMFFKGVFAPTAEELPDGPGIQLDVIEGALPPDLDGTFLRIGPNPWAKPTKRHHVFDGDGMIHSVRIKDGKAFYHNAWMRTPRLLFEQDRGQAYFTRIGELHGLVGLLKAILMFPNKGRLAGIDKHQSGTANTALVALPDGRLWALNEGGAPFEFKVSDEGGIASVGYDSISFTPFSAHPKVHARSRKVFFHGYTLDGGPEKNEYVKYGRLNASGELEAKIPLPVGGASFNHDVLLTENYLVVMDSSVRFTPEKMPEGGSVFTFDSHHTSRIALIPHSAATESDVRWLDLPRSVAWVHPLHAWEEDGGQVLKLWTPLGFKSDRKGGVLEGCCDTWFMSEVRVDLRPGAGAATAEIEVEMVDPEGLHSGEFSRLRDDLLGTGAVRFGFTAAMRRNSSMDFDFDGFTKWDMPRKAVASEFRIPAGWISGEPVFIPRPSPSGDPSDDGFIANFLYGPHPDSTDFALWDARTFSAEPVARLRVPRRVPVGFHGSWLTAEQLRAHLARGGR